MKTGKIAVRFLPWLAFCLIIAFVLVFVPPARTSADGKKDVKIKAFDLTDGFKLLSPIQQDLSGPAALLAEGIPFKEFPPRAPASQGGSGGSVPYRSPAPAFSRNLLLSRDLGLAIHTEPHLAVNPKDPKHVVVAEIDYALSYNPAYVSFDGGENWRGPIRVPLTKNAFSGGDPVVAFDSKGNVYQAFMSVGEKSYDLGPFFIDIPKSDIGVSVSQNGGLKWLPAVSAAQNQFVQDLKPDQFGYLRGFLKFTFLDKPWMDIGPSPGNPKEDVLHISYTEFAEYFSIVYFGELVGLYRVKAESTIMAVASRDGGVTWSQPTAVSPPRKIFELGAQKGGEIKSWVVQGSQPKVSKSGTAYLTWYDSTEDGSSEGVGRIYLAQSKNDGASWSKPVTAVEFFEVSRSPHSVPFRNSSSFPQIAVGENDEVYIAYGAIPKDKQTDEGDIYFVSSKDGAKFSEPVRLNGDKTENIQFFPAIAAGPEGNLHVMWGDTRDDPTGVKYHIYYTRSLDGGKTWGFELKELGIKEPDTRATDFPSNPNEGFPRGRFIGDYFAIAAGSKEDVYMVWADTRLGKYGPMSQKIGFARLKAMPSPETFLNPARGPAGQEVTLQAFNFQPDMDIFVRIGGRITSVGRTNDDGRLSYKLFMPIASEGSHEIAVFDESGNAALSSFYMDFGFGDLKKRNEEQKPEIKKSEEKPSASQSDVSTMLIISLILLGIITLVMVYLLFRIQKSLQVH